MDTASRNPNTISPVGSSTPHLLHEEGKIEEELEGFIRVYRDGSVERFSYCVSNVLPSDKPDQAVASRDAVIDKGTGVWARLYLPESASADEQKRGKLPVVIYFHGGGFVLGSPAWSIYHAFILRLASEIKSVIVSVGYRLAPEHRLPVAYDDCFSAVQWVRQQATRVRQLQAKAVDETGESWLTSYCDFSRCFLAGDSAGGNIVHHVALRAARADVKPLHIRGAIIIQPFFGGERCSKWECETIDPGLSQKWIDVFWKLSLPLGANKDHFACNPIRLSNLPDALLPPVVLCISERDVLRERNMEYFEALKRGGQNVCHVIFKDVGHAFQVLQPQSPRIEELIKTIHDFINTYQHVNSNA